MYQSIVGIELEISEMSQESRLSVTNGFEVPFHDVQSGAKVVSTSEPHEYTGCAVELPPVAWERGEDDAGSVA